MSEKQYLIDRAELPYDAFVADPSWLCPVEEQKKAPAVKCVLIHDNFQNYKGYSIPKAQLVIADIPYNIGTDFYASRPDWYVDGDNNDVARLYINPTRQTSEPTVEVTQSGVTSGSGAEQGSSSKKDASVIASVNLRQGSTTPASVFVDEIKVATAWADLFEAATGIENTESQPSKSRKIMRDGVLIIEHGGKQFNILGTEIK